MAVDAAELRRCVQQVWNGVALGKRDVVMLTLGSGAVCCVCNSTHNHYDMHTQTHALSPNPRAEIERQDREAEIEIGRQR